MSRRDIDPSALFEAARAGDRAALARLLSVVERGGDGARQVGRLAFPHSGAATTVGITGAPGSGKSTLTSTLLTHLRANGQDVAVLAVDPTSPFTGGAILGDRVRMQEHATDPGVFIRSMATRGQLGGLALAAPEAIRVLDAVGHRLVLIETVGVGQVEVEIAGTADTTVVVVNPGWGDSVQANKADRKGVDETRRDIEYMLDLSELGEWRPPIIPTIAHQNQGAGELWAAVERHQAYAESSGVLKARREKRLRMELLQIVAVRLEARARDLSAGDVYETLEADVLARRLDPWAAADVMLGEIGP